MCGNAWGVGVARGGQRQLGLASVVNPKSQGRAEEKEGAVCPACAAHLVWNWCLCPVAARSPPLRALPPHPCIHAPPPRLAAHPCCSSNVCALFRPGLHILSAGTSYDGQLLPAPHVNLPFPSPPSPPPHPGKRIVPPPPHRQILLATQNNPASLSASPWSPPPPDRHVSYHRVHTANASTQPKLALLPSLVAISFHGRHVVPPRSHRRPLPHPQL